MQTCNCRLIVGEKGSDIPKTGITPAEFVILGLMHKGNAGKMPLTDIKVLDEPALTEVVLVEGGNQVTKYRPRTVLEEKRRLSGLYTKAVVAKLFPGAKPQFPDNFDEARDMVIESEVEAAEQDDNEGAELFGTRAEAHAAAKAALRSRPGDGIGEAPQSPSDES